MVTVCLTSMMMVTLSDRKEGFNVEKESRTKKEGS